MIGLSSSYPWLVLGLLGARAPGGVAAVLYLTVKYSPVIGRHFRSAAAVHAAQGRARRAG